MREQTLRPSFRHRAGFPAGTDDDSCPPSPRIARKCVPTRNGTTIASGRPGARLPIAPGAVATVNRPAPARKAAMPASHAAPGLRSLPATTRTLPRSSLSCVARDVGQRMRAPLRRRQRFRVHFGPAGLSLARVIGALACSRCPVKFAHTSVMPSGVPAYSVIEQFGTSACRSMSRMRCSSSRSSR